MSTRQLQLPAAAEVKHREALHLLEKGQLAEALRLLGEVLAEEETCERWNDWAAAEFLAGQFVEAEHGFRYALELAPGDRQAAENLGALLVERQRVAEAIPFLVRAVGTVGERGSAATASLLAECRRQLAEWLGEFKARLREELVPLEQIPRWPLKQYALRLAQLGELDAALEMVRYNRHFHPADLELIKMQACIEMLLQSGTVSAPCAPNGVAGGAEKYARP
jgi:tetratricopeptide (TPR) repeat protein